MRLVVRQIPHPFLPFGRACLVCRIRELGCRRRTREPVQQQREQGGHEREQQHAGVARATGERDEDDEVGDQLGHEGKHLDEVKGGEETKRAHATKGADKEVGFLQTVAHDGVGEGRDVEAETLGELLVLDKEAGGLVHNVLVGGSKCVDGGLSCAAEYLSHEEGEEA